MKRFTALLLTPPYYCFCFSCAFLKEIAMTIADIVLVRSRSRVRDYDAWIIFGYAVLSIVAIAAIFLAAGGPGNSEADIASAVVLP